MHGWKQKKNMVFLNSKGFTSAHKNFDALSPPRLYKCEKWWNLCEERVSKPQTLGVNVSFSGSALFRLPHQSRDSPRSAHFSPLVGSGHPKQVWFVRLLTKHKTFYLLDMDRPNWSLNNFALIFLSTHSPVDVRAVNALWGWHGNSILKPAFSPQTSLSTRPLPHYHQLRIVICNVGIVLTYTLRLIQTPLTHLFAFE